MLETTLQSTSQSAQTVRLPSIPASAPRIFLSLVIGLMLGALFAFIFPLAPTAVAFGVTVLGCGASFLLNGFSQARESGTIWWGFLFAGQLLGVIGILLILLAL